MNTTNDERPPYGPIQYVDVSHNDIVYPEDALMNKPTDRAPLYSNADLIEFTKDLPSAERFTAFMVRAFYESKITSGELRVVKKVVRILEHMESNEMGAEWPIYTHEGNCYPYFDEDAKFCPGCGAQIVKP